MSNKLTNIFANSALITGLLSAASVLAPPFHAQDAPIVTTRVVTSPDQVGIYVDGQYYRSNMAFAWPVGSKHLLAVDEVSFTSRAGARYTFQSWLANDQALSEHNPVTVTADAKLSEFKANFNLEYEVRVSYFYCDPDVPNCASPGKVYVNGTLIRSSTSVWVPAGGSVKLQAVPNPGYVFTGWGTPQDSTAQGFLGSVAVKDPMTVTPLFQVARQIQFVTEPAELQLMLDRSPIYTPRTLEWGRGSTHTISPVTPQQDKFGRWWIFKSWSDGGAATHAYKVAESMSPDLVTATFIRGVRTSLLTVPAGLKLKIDGTDTWPGYNFTWAPDELHPVEAPLKQVDAQGRIWEFQGWSDGQAAAHSISVPESAADLGVRFTATFRQLGRITLNSNLAGLSATVDGASCSLPCTVDRPLGDSVKVTMPASIAINEGSRADFQSWSNGASNGAALQATGTTQTVTAVYRTLNRLSLTSDPPDGANWRLSPDSSDGFYAADSAVSVLVQARPGFRFRRWEGDLAGSAAAATVVMNSPRQARAALDRIPFIPPAGVRNGASDASSDAVAPGSVISIYGFNLAGEAKTGPDNPLLQTLGDVTVRVGDRLLPLFYVSPERISAQLPADIAEGAASVAVRWANQAEVKGEFVVSRNAPGLFQNSSDDRSWAVVAHEDGSLVTSDSPARRGERLRVFGTGFGPTDPQRLLGFGIPSEPVFRITDVVSLRLGDVAVTPESVFAAPGRVGVDAADFRIPEALPGGGAVQLSVTAGDRESNIVLLPVE